MPMLPVPAFVAFVLGYLALRTALSGGRPLLVVFLAACAGQSLLVALVGGYGVDGLRSVLPVSAAMVPPLAWIAFRDAMVARLSPRMAAVHAAAPAFVLFCRLFAPETIDVVVPLVFAGYGCAILLRLRGSADMPLARLDAGRMPALIWQALGWALIASAFGDAADRAGLRHRPRRLDRLDDHRVLVARPSAPGPARRRAHGGRRRRRTRTTPARGLRTARWRRMPGSSPGSTPSSRASRCISIRT